MAQYNLSFVELRTALRPEDPAARGRRSWRGRSPARPRGTAGVIFVQIELCICICVCIIYIYIYIYIYMHTYVCACMYYYVYVYVYLCMNMYVCMYVYMYVCIYIYTLLLLLLSLLLLLYYICENWWYDVCSPDRLRCPSSTPARPPSSRSTSARVPAP